MSGTPGAPKDVQVTVTFDKLRVDWKAPDAGNVSKYKILAKYHDMKQCQGEEIDEATAEVSGSVRSKYIPHPNLVLEGDHLKACTVRVTVTALSEQPQGGSSPGSTTFFDIIKADSPAVGQDLAKNMASLHAEWKEFQLKKHRGSMKVLVVGMQHHGKSTLISSLKRCALGNLDIADETHSAPPGRVETTKDLKTVPLDFRGMRVQLQDTMGFDQAQGDKRAKFLALLSGGMPDGTRCTDIATGASLFHNAPDGAILVVSVLQWVAQRKEVEKTIQDMAECFQTAARGTVCFPYVVAVTKCDEFLKNESQSEDPYKELEGHIEDIRLAANTEKLFPVINYKRTSAWSQEVNKNVFLLLRELVARAKNEDTNVDVRRQRLPWCVGVGAGAVALLLAIVCAAKP